MQFAAGSHRAVVTGWHLDEAQACERYGSQPVRVSVVRVASWSRLCLQSRLVV